MIYIAYYTSKSGIWLVISRVASYFHELKASTNTAYELKVVHSILHILLLSRKMPPFWPGSVVVNDYATRKK